MPGAERSIVINAPIDKVFAVITDYAKYPEFLSDVTAVRILEQHADGVTIEQTLNLIKQVSLVIRLKETPSTAVDWSLTKAGALKTNNGRWRLKDQGDGTTHATYGLEVELGGWVPGMGTIVSKLTETTLPATLNAFKARAESL